jgi:type I restriction enzyme S subunit
MALPKNWCSASLNELCVPTEQVEPFPEREFFYIDISAVDRHTKRISYPQRLMGLDAPSRARKLVQTGDTLVSMTRPNLNAVALVPSDLDGQIASTGFEVLRAPALDPRWLAYLVRTSSFVNAMSALVQGALYPAVRSKDVRAFTAPVAPRAEQARIADKLDTVLARVDSCRERLARIPPLVKRFRQSVLAAATSGRLTEDWRQVHGSPVHVATKLGALCEEGRVITYGVIKLGDEVADGVPCLRTSNVRWLRIDSDGVKRISKGLSAEYARTILRGSEVLVNVRGTLGGVAVATPDMAGWNVSREVAVVPVDQAKICSRFAALWIASEETQRWLSNVERGVAYVGINIEDLRELPIRLPSLVEQKEVVRRVETLFAFADRLEARLAQAQTAVDRLTPSLLAKAFRGELVPQDPNDEPASALLARTAAARNAAPSTSRTRSPRAGRLPRAPKESATMTKSRQDDDVMGQPYLAKHLRRIGTPATAEVLFKVAELPVGDFYKQLAWEVAQGHVKDNQTTLEPGHAAG